MRISRISPICAIGQYLRVAVAVVGAMVLPGMAGGQDLTITGGWVFDSVGDDVRRNEGIVVRGGKIASMNGGEAGEGSESIELGTDLYVMPGIVDLHAHHNVNLFGRLRRDDTEVMPVLYLANGVTTTYPAGEFDPEAMEALRKGIERGERIGPRLLNSGPYFGSARNGWDREASPDQIAAEVDHWAERGVSGFKAKGIGPEHLEALIGAAHRHGLTVTGHLGSGARGSVNPRDAIEMGIDRIEHFLGGDAMPSTRSAYASLENLDPESPEVDEIIRLYIERGVVFNATLTAFNYFGPRGPEYDHWTDETRFFTPHMRGLLAEREPRRQVEQFAKIYQVKKKTIKRYYDAGGTITLGTDHVSWGEYLPGFSVHREMHALVQAGIPPAAAIKIGTINGARAIGVGDRLGSLEAGKLGDMVVVRGNPLEDIRHTHNVVWVIRGGVAYAADDLLKSVEGKLGPVDAEDEENW